MFTLYFVYFNIEIRKYTIITEKSRDVLYLKSRAKELKNKYKIATWDIRENGKELFYPKLVGM